VKLQVMAGIANHHHAKPCLIGVVRRLLLSHVVLVADQAIQIARYVAHHTVILTHNQECGDLDRSGWLGENLYRVTPPKSAKPKSDTIVARWLVTD
jgi:hypothetical protein